MKPRQCVALVALVLLLCCCKAEQKPAIATLALKESRVALGGQVDLVLSGVPDGWSGWAVINNKRSLQIDAQHPNFHVTVENSFAVQPKNEITVSLVDRNGLEIGLRNALPMTVAVFQPQVVISPDTDALGPDGGSGRIRVTVAAGYKWTAGTHPDWIQLRVESEGDVRGLVEYQVAPNKSLESRSAQVAIGDALLQITQSSAHSLNTSGAQSNSPAAGDNQGTSGLAPAAVTLSSERIVEGGDLQIQIDHMADDWRGDVTVNSNHHFSVDGKVIHLKTIPSNGFTAGEQAEIYVLLTNQHGHPIPVTIGGRFRVLVIPRAVTLDNPGRSVEAGGTSGSFRVEATPGNKWSVTGAPDWVRIDPAKTGPDQGSVSYKVQANVTNDDRSASLRIGDATFEITQAHLPVIQIPFQDSFGYTTPPPPYWMLLPPGAATHGDSPVRWTWDEQPGQRTVLSLTKESPSKGTSLLITKPAQDTRDWAMQVFLPHVNLLVSAEYNLAVWMRAENPGPVSLLFGQNTEPYRGCGLYRTVAATESWQQFEARFRVPGNNCDSGNNRLTIQAGRIRGKLWITDLSLTSAP